MRRINTTYDLNPETKEQVIKIIQAFHDSNMSYKAFAAHMGISYQLIHMVFHKQRKASKFFLSEAQKVFPGLDTSVPTGVRKSNGKAPTKPPFRKSFICPVCKQGDFVLYRGRTKFLGDCNSCKTRVTFQEDLEQLNRSELLTIVIEKTNGFAENWKKERTIV